MTSERESQLIGDPSPGGAPRPWLRCVLQPATQLVVASDEIDVPLEIENLQYAQKDRDRHDRIPPLEASDGHAGHADASCHLRLGDATPETRESQALAERLDSAP
jgi:hypothetical protein